MAPKRGLRLENSKAGSSKRARLNVNGSTKKRGGGSVSRGINPAKIEVDIYSPNVDSTDVSEFTEDEQEPRNVTVARLDGTLDDDDDTGLRLAQAARELRAKRRAAEKRDEDFTEDEDQGVFNFRVEIEEPSDEAGSDSSADAEGEDVEEELVPPGVGTTNPIDEIIRSVMLGAKDEGLEDPVANIGGHSRNPFLNEESVSNTDQEDGASGAALLAQAEGQYPTPEYGGTPRPSGAEMRYRELMARRFGHSGLPAVIPQVVQPSLFTPPPTSRFHDPSMAGLYDSTSSSSSSSSSGLEDPAGPLSPTSSSSSVFPSLEELGMQDLANQYNIGNRAASQPPSPAQAAGADTVPQENSANDEDDYIVSRRDKTLDKFLSVQLRKIARALNFMVRAKASGIEVDDFDALASVDPEEWADLVETPPYAAEVMVDTMLNMSIWDIFILSNRATMLLDELDTLGIVI